MEVTITDPATIGRMMAGLKAPAAPVRKFSDAVGNAVSPERKKLLDEIADLMVPENMSGVDDEQLAAFRDALKAASMTGGNVGMSETAKVRVFSEQPRNVAALRAAGKTPGQFVRDFEAARAKRPGLTAKDYGVGA